MQMPKPTDADKERFRELVPEVPGVEVKPMFDNLGAFVNGNMFAGLFGPAVGVKLAAGDLAELAAVGGAGPFGPAERPMGGYLALPPTLGGEEAAYVGAEGPHVRRDAAAEDPKEVAARPGPSSCGASGRPPEDLGCPSPPEAPGNPGMAAPSRPA